ncbi:unnamed protein product [Discosporangium mesarthrocarpum]
MIYVLSQQAYFKAAKPSLQILVERFGGECLMLPKYHCELNPTKVV